MLNLSVSFVLLLAQVGIGRSQDRFCPVEYQSNLVSFISCHQSLLTITTFSEARCAQPVSQIEVTVHLDEISGFLCCCISTCRTQCKTIFVNDLVAAKHHHENHSRFLLQQQGYRLRLPG